MPKLEFYYFHLMPYPYLPENFKETYNSTWVTLPNTFYDPEKGHALYNRYIDELVKAEEYGWDGICVNEHHQNAYGTMPSPNIIAAMLTQRTKKAKIGIIGNALPLHDDPLRVAEEIAMLDVISGGRIISGFVRGTGMEYHSYNVNPAHSRERFYEAHDLIIQAWTRPGPFSFEGRHYNYRYVNTWPRPMQKPHPPIWLPGTGSLETVEYAAEKRYPFMMVFSPQSFQRKAYEAYRRIAEEKFGYEAQPNQLAFAVPTYVAETDEIALKEAEPHIMWLFHKGLHTTRQFSFPPGYVTERSLSALLRSGIKQFHELTFRDLIDQGYIIVGSPATVIEKLSVYVEDMKAGMLIGGAHCGDMPEDLVNKNMELFSKEVMPHFR
jgi:alkanesulfonate monooxygenase SsuD/methylene tetrahydromethanopterin reductase-like flavin-dependent oxidoreductase (luciferase family)